MLYACTKFNVLLKCELINAANWIFISNSIFLRSYFNLLLGHNRACVYTNFDSYLLFIVDAMNTFSKQLVKLSRGTDVFVVDLLELKLNTV